MSFRLRICLKCWSLPSPYCLICRFLRDLQSFSVFLMYLMFLVVYLFFNHAVNTGFKYGFCVVGVFSRGTMQSLGDLLPLWYLIICSPWRKRMVSCINQKDLFAEIWFFWTPLVLICVLRERVVASVKRQEGNKKQSGMMKLLK